MSVSSPYRPNEREEEDSYVLGHGGAMDASAISLPIDDPMGDPTSPYRRRTTYTNNAESPNNFGEDNEEDQDDTAPSMTKEQLEEQIRALVMSPAGTSLMDVLVQSNNNNREDSYNYNTLSSATGNNNSTMNRDYFGATDRMYGKGQVSINQQISEAENEVVLIDLPPSLSVLYAAGFASQGKTSVVNLMAMLSGIAYIREKESYKEASARHRQDNDACYRLHVRSKESADRLAALREKLHNDRVEAEMAECTFNPNVKIWEQEEIKRKADIHALKIANTKGGGHGQKSSTKKKKSIAEDGEEGAVAEEDADAAAAAAMEGGKQEEEEEQPKKRTTTAFIAHCYEWAKGREKKIATKVEKYNAEFKDTIEETRVPFSKKTEMLAQRHKRKQNTLSETVAVLSKFDGKRAAFAAAATSLKHQSGGGGAGEDSAANNTSGVSEHDAATKVRSLLDCGVQQSPTSHQRVATYRRSVLDSVTDQHYYPSFEPITNSISRREDMFMKYLQYEAETVNDGNGYQQDGSPEDSGDEEEYQDGEQQEEESAGANATTENGDATTIAPVQKRRKKKVVNTSNQDGEDSEGEGMSPSKSKPSFYYDPAVIEEVMWAGKTDTAKTVQRLLDDVEQRKVRQAQRLEDDKLRQRELMYDPQTGQPLFQPNSMPTVLINKKRVPIDELPPSDRAEALKILRQKHLDFLHDTAKKKKGQNSRDLADFFNHCSELQSKAQKRVEKIRKLEEKELTGLFVPKIDEQSGKIVESRGREQVHKRELPVKEKPPTPPKKKESDGDRISSMLERSKTWEQRRNTKLQRKEKDYEKELAKECTFSPKMQKAKNDKLAAAAESRVASEMAVMRSKSEQLVATSLAGKQQQQSLRRGTGSQQSSLSRHSTSRIPLAAAPATSVRRNVMSGYQSQSPARGPSELFMGGGSHSDPYYKDYSSEPNPPHPVPTLSSPTPTLEELSRGDNGSGYPRSPQYSMSPSNARSGAAAAAPHTYTTSSYAASNHSSSHAPSAGRGADHSSRLSASAARGYDAEHNHTSSSQLQHHHRRDSGSMSNASVDKLIGSWNELDSITNEVLGKLERDQRSM